MTVDVIIPVYKPGKELITLLDKLKEQSVPVNKIILLNTEEKYFEELIYGTDFLTRHKDVSVTHLSKWEFDHGRTRRLGVSKSTADIFVMMTQDAMPRDDKLIERLIANLSDKVAVAYARQLPGEYSSIEEKISREFNYPPQSVTKSLNDLGKMGIKTYFCSNVCAAYRRDIYDKLGGFVKKAIFNEDMIYAATAINAGYLVSYEAEALVIHSHNYSNMQQFKRNFDLGVSQAQNKNIFANVASESEGKRLVVETTKRMKENHQLMRLPHFYIQCFSKYAGYLCGKNYDKLPKKLVLKMTSNKEYWQD